MSLSTQTVFDNREVVRAMQKMEAAGGDLGPIFRQVRADMREDVADHFKARLGPNGSRWAPPDPDYVARQMKRKGTVRKRGKNAGQLTKRGAKRIESLGTLGKLKSLGIYQFELARQSITMQLRPGSRIERLAVHQEGGAVGKGSRLPARPFLWASDKLLGRFARRLERRLLEAWG